MLFRVTVVPSTFMHVRRMTWRPESRTVILHPFLENVTRLLQCSGGEDQVHLVTGLLDATHSLAALFPRRAVGLCCAELHLQGLEIGCAEAARGVRDPMSMSD